MWTSMKNSPDGTERNAFRIPEIAESMSIGRSTLYKMIADGGGPRTTKLGATTLVLRQDLDCWLEQLKREQRPHVN